MILTLLLHPHHLDKNSDNAMQTDSSIKYISIKTLNLTITMNHCGERQNEMYFTTMILPMVNAQNHDNIDYYEHTSAATLRLQFIIC